MSITEAGNMKSFVEGVIDFYERRVTVVSSVMKETAELLQNFRLEQETMAGQLRDILAKQESLRRRDFDMMIEDLRISREGREKEVVEMLEHFQSQEEKMVSKLRSVVSGSSEVKLGDFKLLSQTILGEQKEREKEMVTLLRSFHLEQEEFSAALRKLLSKGEQVRIKDFKAMLESIRLSQKGRETEVGKLLGDFERVQEEVGLRWGKVIESYV
ncbi:MAG: hypothetical protein HQ596_03620 [Candidatus Saganbacteria bacterium]|nr:hypothetical protein [Candidatus Saganbacteria bacterium]